MAEAEAGADAARHWMRMKNAGRTLGKILNPILPSMFSDMKTTAENELMSQAQKGLDERLKNFIYKNYKNKSKNEIKKSYTLVSKTEISSLKKAISRIKKLMSGRDTFSDWLSLKMFIVNCREW